MDHMENTAYLLLPQSSPWEHACPQWCQPATTAYTCLLQICCLAANVVSLSVSRSLSSNGYTRYIAPTLWAFVPNSLQAYRHFFFSKGCACDVCDWSQLPSPWLISHGDYSPTAPTAPSLRLLVPSGSLIGCQSLQVYHHHLAFPIRVVGQNYLEWVGNIKMGLRD
jgi:hypothetical protein